MLADFCSKSNKKDYEQMINEWRLKSKRNENYCERCKFFFQSLVNDSNQIDFYFIFTCAICRVATCYILVQYLKIPS